MRDFCGTSIYFSRSERKVENSLVSTPTKWMEYIHNLLSLFYKGLSGQLILGFVYIQSKLNKIMQKILQLLLLNQ